VRPPRSAGATSINAERWLAEVGDDPVGEGVPEGGFAEGKADLLDKNQERSCPKGGAVDFSCGPEVVGDEEEQENVGEQTGDQDFPGAEGEGPAGDCGDHESSGGDVDIALMCGRILAIAEGEINECGEEEHVAHRDEVEGLGIAAEWVELAGVTDEGVGGSHDAENHHEAAEEEASDAEATVDVGAAGGDEGGLCYEKENPSGEGSAVDVNDRAGQRRAENAGEKIAASESDKYGDEHEERHDGKEVVVVTSAGQPRYGADRLLRFSYKCCQDASVRTWAGEECAST